MDAKKLSNYEQECCGGDCHCECDEVKGDFVKIYFCPKCRSEKVGYTFGLKNLFGVIPTMKCKNCGFSAKIFPQFVVDKNKLNNKKKIKTKVKKKKK